MKVLLVNPPRSPHNAIFEHAPAEIRPFIHRRLVGPPLGLLTVAQALRGHDVSLLEMKGEYDLNPGAPPPAALLREHLERIRPDVVGLTVIASEFPAAVELAAAARAFDPRIVTVAGGLHPTLCPRDFAETEVDVLCPGQSAHLFRKLVESLERGPETSRPAGLWVRRGGALTWLGRAAALVNGADEDFLLPERSLLKRWLSTYTVGGGKGPATYVFSSLGCPYRCTFCSIWPQYDGRFFQRRVESLIAELKTLDDYPIVRFADANTIVDSRFVNSLFDRIEEEEIRKEFIMDVRADTAVRFPGLIEKLARNGLKVVICGFESFRDEELARYDKAGEASLIHEAIRVFHRNGIQVRGNYVVPPDYTEADFEALGEFAASHEVAFAGYTILTPMPGTPLHTEMQPIIVETDLSYYNFFNSVLKTSLPHDEFCRRVAELWRIRKGRDVI
jgi:radical SAM superfamily enzyme YgiQ (UPF0313 family)